VKALFALAAAVLCAAGYAADFRSHNWGESAAEVIAAEGNPTMAGTAYPGNYTHNLMYTAAEHLGHEVSMLIEFAEGEENEKLSYAICLAESDDLSVFHDWEAALTDEYGEPLAHDELTTAEEDKLDEYYRGEGGPNAEGVKRGYFELRRLWETPTTYVGLEAGANDDGIATVMRYYSKEYAMEDYERTEGRLFGTRAR
jgi:hypothetical protein